MQDDVNSVDFGGELNFKTEQPENEVRCDIETKG